MDERREVQGTNGRGREPVRLRVRSGNDDLTVALDDNRQYLQRLAQVLFKPKREDGTP
jgi:hypothetical protein